MIIQGLERERKRKDMRSSSAKEMELSHFGHGYYHFFNVT